jgi:hypothetical protein
MDAGYVGFVLFLLACLGLPVALILTPRVRELWTTDKGRGRALEEFLLSLGVLSAPWLFLMGMQIRGLAPHRDDGWLPIGLCLGLPLWAMWRLLLRLAQELVVLVGRVGRRPWAGESGWGKPLEDIFCSMLLLVPAFMWFMFMVLLLEMSLDPNPR